MSSQFVYVTYIKTAADKLWEAIISPEFNKQFWFGMHQESDFKPGSSWTLKFEDGRIADAGEVLESVPPRRLVLKWRNEFKPELKAEGFSRCVMEIEPAGETCKLTITHSIEQDEAKFIQAVSGGWPRVLSGLKTLLETGAPLPATK
ncbi:MAG TPA: SRPBCC family protein [Rhizomicrobium sp.]|nr:SRPBCC family protein [Rhizomicrobium sp.]